MGLLNGLDPDRRELARAPELGALACLYAATAVAHLALRAVHDPTACRGADAADPVVDAAAHLLDSIAELRVALRRYANRRVAAGT